MLFCTRRTENEGAGVEGDNAIQIGVRRSNNRPDLPICFQIRRNIILTE